MKNYLLIKSDEDGNCVSFLDDKKLQELLDDPEGYASVEEFLNEIPSNYVQEWQDGKVILCEFKILVPKIKTTAFRLD
jgi:hypothetical protein